ncbi:MAG: Lrp/AsnC family transcriptional regulator [Gammaproteobacteria bacterium]|nr:Lrp/AsnC family transcriptional regulator [Gammaproteobacteria bacterium]MDH5514290.1 Lrp/AsnC family transcriptional regulator [Gammaproteobacteria bacterium]
MKNSLDRLMDADDSEPLVDELDRRIIQATQAGLPLDVRPYHALAEALEVAVDVVMARLSSMRERGIIRRIAAVPNHYALGYKVNGMSVWDVPDDSVARLGKQVGALDFVSHCYQRPRHLPVWPYNLFAMVHGQTREAVEDQVGEIAALLEGCNRGHEVLYSTRILKKTGLRISK